MRTLLIVLILTSTIHFVFTLNKGYSIKGIEPQYRHMNEATYKEYLKSPIHKFDRYEVMKQTVVKYFKTLPEKTIYLFYLAYAAILIGFVLNLLPNKTSILSNTNVFVVASAVGLIGLGIAIFYHDQMKLAQREEYYQSNLVEVLEQELAQPRTDCIRLERQRDSLYFLINSETIKTYRKEIYREFVEKIDDDESFETFLAKYSNSEKAEEFYKFLFHHEIPVGSLSYFKTGFYGIYPVE